jgi:hypothetical protein
MTHKQEAEQKMKKKRNLETVSSREGHNVDKLTESPAERPNPRQRRREWRTRES